MNDQSGETVRILSEEILVDDWARLTKYTIELRRRDGLWEKQVRQVYDRGNGACILPYDPARGTVLLVRQFRMPLYVTGHAAYPIEACAGLLDELDPEAAIVKEAEEELGYRLENVKRILNLFMSPGSVSEELAFFTANYRPSDRISEGGGHAHEGEDIEVLELSLSDAHEMIKRGEIADAKTVILIQHLKLEQFSV